MAFWTNKTKGHDGNGTIPPPIQSTKALGTTTVVNGTINCLCCGTGNPVSGRPGQSVKNYTFTCRTCPARNVFETVNFACNN